TVICSTIKDCETSAEALKYKSNVHVNFGLSINGVPRLPPQGGFEMPLSERSASLAEVLDEMTTEGAEELTERLAGGGLRCYACGHRCLIHEGKRGICKVRFNEGGRLLVPTNYVAALQCDPTEKKPFFHVLPGSDTLTFGMLGCDLHCAYCFTGDTVVVTDRGPARFDELFNSSSHVERRPDAEIAFYEDLRAVAASGELRRVRGVFKHSYRSEEHTSELQSPYDLVCSVMLVK